MKKDFKTLLCISAFVGAMSSCMVLAADNWIITNNQQPYTNEYNSITVETGGKLHTNVQHNIKTGIFTNKDTVWNHGTLTTNTIDNEVNSTFGQENGQWGALIINNGGTNAGLIQQEYINTVGGNLSNTGTITAQGQFVNGATITGSATNVSVM